MVQLSREESVVLLTCRPELDPADDKRLAAIVRQPLDWPLVLWRAETFQTVPLLDHHIERLGIDDAVPPDLRAYIRNWTALSQARSVEQFRELGLVLNMLQGLGIDHFIMKGAALAGIAYADPLLRPMQDLDVMIHPRDARRVQREIYRFGYKHGVFDPQSGRFTHMFRRISNRSLRFKHALHSVTKMVRIPSPVPASLVPSSWRRRQIKSFVHADETVTIPIFIDFHVNLASGMDLEDVWRGVTSRPFLGQRVRTQSVTALLWFSAMRLYHEAFQHGTLKLQMFGDVDGLLRTRADEIDWAELIVIAKKYRLEPALYYVLAQAARINAAPVPEGVTALLEPSPLHPPAAEDWGDVMPKLMSRAVLTEFELA